jgi:hypothetical protein
MQQKRVGSPSIIRIRTDFMLSLSETANELSALSPATNGFSGESFRKLKVRV